MRFAWIKEAISGATYARALENRARRSGHAVTPDMFADIAAQPKARFDTDMSSFARSPGALFPSPERRRMMGLAREMPWAGDEHAHPAQSATAVGELNHLLKRRGLEYGSPSNAAATQKRINDTFGDPNDTWKTNYRQDQLDASTRPAPAQQTAVLQSSRAAPRAATPAPVPRPSPNVISRFGRGPAVAKPAIQSDSASPIRSPMVGQHAGTFVGRKVGSALPALVGAGIPLAVGGGMLLKKPGIQSNVKNLLEDKGSTQEQDLGGQLHPTALAHADKIHQALLAHGLDPATVRMGIDAPPGSGKTTLARAVAQRAGMKHYGLDWEPGNWWKSTIGLGRNVEKMPRAPKAGEILEHYMLGRTYDPELFDAMVHIRKDPEVIKEQLRSRGNAAYISDMMDLHKSLGVAGKAFDTLGGDMIDIGDGVQLKLRPRDGWGNALDQQLMQMGIDPTGLSRHEKLLSLQEGKRSTGAGWTPYVKNPFSTGETLALGASVPLGIMAAKALARRAAG